MTLLRTRLARLERRTGIHGDLRDLSDEELCAWLTGCLAFNPPLDERERILEAIEQLKATQP